MEKQKVAESRTQQKLKNCNICFKSEYRSSYSGMENLAKME